VENTTTPFSQRGRPALCAATLELHLLCLQLLSQIHETKATKIRLATERAAHAVELAAIGSRREHHLRKAIAEMGTTLLFVRALHLEGKLGLPVSDYLRRQIDQIVAGVEQLRATRPDEWVGLELPPLEAEAIDPSANPERRLAQRVLTRLTEILRKLLAVESPPEPSSGGNLEPI
jgi:hypothetical protein